ncbi:MAG: lipopolysaccharide heptosyltransferase I [Mariprofundaceae bacterium]|nr:lipopolysaccharide heptosyltransferase I [Mariprofundaceae bacterium]
MMKILIVKLSAFGDIIHTLPALNDLLEHPEVGEVHWLVDSRYAFVTGIFPPQVNVHQIDLKDSCRWWQTWKTIQSLKKKRFDAVLDLQGLIKSGVLARFISDHVFGIDPHYVREKPNRYFTHPVHFHPDEKHVVQQSRRIAAAPFSKLFPRNLEQIPEHPISYREPHVPLTLKMEQAAEQTLSQWGLESGSYVWLHLGGGWETKQLPQRTWENVTNGLAEAGLNPILGWGNDNEKKRAENIKKRAELSFFPTEKLNIYQLCGILSKAKAVVGADTGVIHLAAALGVPTVSFWGPSASWRSGPLGNTDQHIESNPTCSPCFKRNCNQFICMDMINADDILAAIDDVSSSR